ncbi:MAG: phosphoribosyl-AMP cyclohydrolase [Candidatus Woesearchaeota archaeon]
MIELDFKKGNGLIPAIAQDFKTGEILMLAYMNKEAFENTLKTGKATYFSRSRNELWVKGETSGNVQSVKEILVDCDNDTIVLKIEQKGGACHTGYRSCFYRKIEGNKIVTVGKKVFDPKEVYG